MKPNREKHEIGRISAIFDDYAIIDESVVVSFFTIKTQLKLSEEYEYEAIETSCLIDGRSFYWRVINVVKHIECEADRSFKSSHGVQMHDSSCSFRQEFPREMTHSAMVFNNSNEPVTLKTCEITSNSGLIRLDRSVFNFQLRPGTGKHNIYLKIQPKTVGSFVEELTADFGDFRKKCLVTLQVHSDNRAKNISKRNENNDFREIIPGQRVRQAPRFIEIRIKDYIIPQEFRYIDYKKQIDLVLDDLKDKYPFLFEPLSRDNYVAKMRCCLYLEEIAMEIHFARYKIERGHFENKQEFLRLEIEGVAEKRPSLSFGDSIQATEVVMSKSFNKKPIYEGCIHKVEHNAILLKFHQDFHQSHNRRDHRIDFFFSRATYKRQQHALDKAVSQIGIGYDFLFPTIRGQIKKPQIDATLKSNEKMEINGKDHPWFNDKLNKYQKQAVVNVLRGVCRPLPYIIYGPPGNI